MTFYATTSNNENSRRKNNEMERNLLGNRFETTESAFGTLPLTNCFNTPNYEIDRASTSDANDAFIDNILHAHEEKFCTYSKVNIFTTTFNVNGKSPPESLYEWLHFDTTNLPDIIAIGLQEMDLTLGTYVIDNNARQDEWLFVLNRNLPNIYKQVAHIRLIGIFLILYKREDAKVKVSQVFLSSTPTGFLKFGNKGGVGISLRLNDSLVCFVNSHLAAGNHELSKRNQDFREISQMRFVNGFGIYDHEMVFWLGDLNYRLNTLTYDEVITECNTDRFSRLFHFDQLKEQQRLKTAFNGFQEKTPTFRPTYKFDVGTSNWDSSEKKRVPAWCDRILYWLRDRKCIRVEQLSYNSVERVTFSDHKPVCSTFLLTVKRIDHRKRDAVYEEVLRESDKRANELLPQITLSQNEFNFGEISLQEPSVGILVIKNTGLTPTRFAFAASHQEKKEILVDSWLTVTPKSSFLDIGADVEVTLQVSVPGEALKNNVCELSCILVLRLDKGRDYFVVVTAKHTQPRRPLGKSESAVDLEHGRFDDGRDREKILRSSTVASNSVNVPPPTVPTTAATSFPSSSSMSQQRSRLKNNTTDDWLIDLG